MSGKVLTDDAARDGLATDFGHYVIRKPAAVVRPASADDVAKTVKFSAQRGLAVATRGSGHSQSGQSLSNDIVLDMAELAEIRNLDDKSGAVVCGGGLKWRALVESLLPQHLSPPVLTNNLDTAIAGTLSTAGLGVASWKYGTQADNVLELEVVTGTGEMVRCSPEKNTDLFDSVRGGMGQFGVITEAKLRLRRIQPRFRSFYLLYDDLAALLKDLEILMAEERFDYLESWCVPCPQGFKKIGGPRPSPNGTVPRQAFAQWFYPLHATLETDGTVSPETVEEKLRGLKFYKHVHTEEGDMGEFYARLDPLFALWKRSGAWEFTHPWMECVLPWQTAPMYIGQVLENMPPQAIAGGHILLWPGRGRASTVPLFMRPETELVMGFGILPAVPKQFFEEALPRLGLASTASMMMGGKRYLSGWIAFDHAMWKAHYGPKWDTVVAMKKKFDPKGILNPGFVKYE